MSNSPGDSKKLVKQTIHSYLDRDYDAFRALMTNYARTFYKNQIQDLSDASVMGLLMDLPSFIGDSQAFYLDHLFHELDINTAREQQSIEKILNEAGVPIVGAAPSSVNQQFTIEVPVDTTVSYVAPKPEAIPVIRSLGTVVTSDSGIDFELTEDIDYFEKDSEGNYLATIQIAKRNAANQPTTVYMTRTGLCVSGKRTSEAFQMGDFKAFYRYTLLNPNVTQIISIIDGNGNEYYQVGDLAEDTVYKALPNKAYDVSIVKEQLVPYSAVYRYTTKTALNSRQTSVVFGGGSSIDSDLSTLVDPSQYAIPLYGKKVFNKFSLNPNLMLRSKSLGLATPNTAYTITYRYGGGITHNIRKGLLRNITTVNMDFPRGATITDASSVRTSVQTVNIEDASGGEDAPTTDQLKALVPVFRASQKRIVTPEDLIARVYTLPTNFGRAFRCAVHSNPNNPLVSMLYIVSRDIDGYLVMSPDTLKKNLVSYFKTIRLTTDSIEIMDSQIINLKVNFKISVESNQNRDLVLQAVLNRLYDFFDVRKFDIDQPIVIDDIRNLIYNTPGVLSVVDLQIGVPKDTAGRTYSNAFFDVKANTVKNILFAPKGGIFEVKYPAYDIVGLAI